MPCLKMSQHIAWIVIYIFFLETHFQNAHARKKLCRLVQAMIFLFCGKKGSRSIGKIMDTDNIIL